ncbi:MAG: LuxR C-terminal-related transcriptional regulator [Treponema sp.]|nr:LuxR C-terminal-related transcriptional regulator [Treponema sp.]
MVASRSKFISGLLAEYIIRVKPSVVIQCVEHDKGIENKLEQNNIEMLFIEASFYQRKKKKKVLEIIERFIGLQVIVFGFEEYDEYLIRRFIKCGIVGFISYRDGIQEFEKNISKVLKGGYVMPEQFADMDEDLYSWKRSKLYGKDVQIIKLTLQEKDYNGIAAALDISPQTVRNRKSIIYEKLHVSNSVGLVKIVLKKGIVSVDEFLSM